MTPPTQKKPTRPAEGRDEDLRHRVRDLEAEVAERERTIAELRLAAAGQERESQARLAAASEELSELRYFVNAWNGRRATRFIRLIDDIKRVAAPVGSARGQALGYTHATVAMSLAGAVKAVRKAAGPLLPAPAGPDPEEASPGEPAAGPPAEPASCNTGMPLISVIMPVFNAQRAGEHYLRDALHSVAAQTYRTFELIVVDDGSTDGTAAVVEEFVRAHPELSITFLHKDNGGQSSARNLGARHTRGEWLAFLDQDDEWMPERLHSVIPHLVREVDLVYTDADTMDENGEVVLTAIHSQHGAGGKHPKTSLEDGLYQDIFVMPGVTTLRKELFERIGGFDERLSGYEDDDLILRAIQGGRIGYVPVSTLRWRQYAANYSRSHRMVDSRIFYWRKLLRDYTDGGRDKARARRITLRFLREFLTQCALRSEEGDSLGPANLHATTELLPYIGPVDRAAFALTRWAWTRRDKLSFYARWWFLNGLETPAAGRSGLPKSG
jgi:glycosyltransferase involved in cell wall biosynthesis